MTLWQFLLGENSYSTLFLSNKPFLYYSWRNWREPSWHLRNPSHVDFLALGYCHFTLFALRMLQGIFFQILIGFFISLQAVYCSPPTLPSWGLTYPTWPIWSMHLAMSVCKRTFLLLLRLFCRFFLMLERLQPSLSSGGALNSLENWTNQLSSGPNGQLRTRWIANDA